MRTVVLVFALLLAVAGGAMFLAKSAPAYDDGTGADAAGSPGGAPEAGASQGAGSGAGQHGTGPDGWLSDLRLARKLAKEQGKYLLLNFTGSAWCAPCQQLHRDVFEGGAMDAAQGDYVFVTLDFTEEAKAVATGDVGREYEALLKTYGISGFPTVLLTTPDGIAFGRLGFDGSVPQGERAAVFVETLRSKSEETRFIQARVPEIQGAVSGARSPAEAEAASKAALDLLEAAGEHPVARELVPLVEGIVASALGPPRDSRSAAKGIQALASAGAVSQNLLDQAFEIDPQNLIGLPEAAVAGALRGAGRSSVPIEGLLDSVDRLKRLGRPVDPVRAAKMYADAAYWADAWLQDGPRARSYALRGLVLEPTDKRVRAVLEDFSSSR